METKKIPRGSDLLGGFWVWLWSFLVCLPISGHFYKTPKKKEKKEKFLPFPSSLFWPGDWLYTVSRTLLVFLYFFSADLNIDVRVTTIRGIIVFYVTMGKETVQNGAERWWWVTAHWQPGPVSQLYPERTQIYITNATYIQYLAYIIKYNMGGFS